MTVNFSEISMHSGPEESPGYLLWKASTLWRRRIEAALKPLMLTHPQFVVLAATAWLGRKGTIRQIDIAHFVGLDPNTTSQILTTLTKKNLIQRKAQDGRSKSPTLTKGGQELLAQAMPIVEQEDANFFSQINTASCPFLKGLYELAQ